MKGFSLFKTPIAAVLSSLAVATQLHVRKSYGPGERDLHKLRRRTSRYMPHQSDREKARRRSTLPVLKAAA